MRSREVVERHPLSVVRGIPSIHQQGPVLEGPHGVDPGLHGGVDEAAVYPGRDLVLLLPRSVRRLAGAGVVLTSVERHRALTPALRVERVVALGDGDLGDLYWTGLHLTGHQDLRGDDLK